MPAINKILLLLDKHPPPPALLEKIVLLAKKFGARLELFESCYSRSLVSSYLFDPQGVIHARQGYLCGEEKRLQAVADQLEQAGIDVSIDAVWDADTEQAVLLKIERYAPDLVIKNCRYPHRLSEYLFGNLDLQLLRHCSMPLLLMRPKPWRASPVVVTALDPLQQKPRPVYLDDTVLRWGESLVEYLGGVLHLFSAYQALPASVIFDDTLMLDGEDLRTRLARRHQLAMDALITAHGLQLAAFQVHLARGEVHKELPRYAEAVNADILVLGGMERDTSQRLFLGSTTEQVLDHIDADVLVVRMGA
ncbi:MAG: universal stress protein E [Motiliproteus sp.]|jgi:universal stress protein E